MPKETHSHAKRDPFACQKRPYSHTLKDPLTLPKLRDALFYYCNRPLLLLQ